MSDDIIKPQSLKHGATLPNDEPFTVNESIGQSPGWIRCLGNKWGKEVSAWFAGKRPTLTLPNQ